MFMGLSYVWYSTAVGIPYSSSAGCPLKCSWNCNTRRVRSSAGCRYSTGMVGWLACTGTKEEALLKYRVNAISGYMVHPLFILNGLVWKPSSILNELICKLCLLLDWISSAWVRFCEFSQERFWGPLSVFPFRVLPLFYLDCVAPYLPVYQVPGSYFCLLETTSVFWGKGHSQHTAVVLSCLVPPPILHWTPSVQTQRGTGINRGVYCVACSVGFPNRVERHIYDVRRLWPSKRAFSPRLTLLVLQSRFGGIWRKIWVVCP